MNSEQLHYFELAYKERSFSAAARRVPVSPQGLTKAIHALERELGVELFSLDGETGLPVPTEYAHELYEFAAVYDSNVRLLYESFGRIRGQEEHEVRLGCSLGVVGLMGQGFMSDFAVAYPHIHVSYWESNDALADAGLREGTSDLALTIAPVDPSFTSMPLYRCRWYFWVPADSPLACRASLTVEDLAGCDVAIPGKGYRCYDQLRALALEAHVPLGSIFEMSELFQVFEFVVTGRGLGFTVEHLIGLSVFQNEGVVAVPLEGIEWGFDLARLATHALSAAEGALWDWCATYARRLPCNRLAR